MTRYVIGPDVALYLAREDLVASPDHQLLAPTLIRSSSRRRREPCLRGVT